MAFSDQLNSNSSANETLVKEDDKSRQEVANVADEQTGGGHSTVDIPSETIELDFGRPGTLHRVPAHVRANKEYLYTPVVFPLGPYHHDEVRFHQAEHLKIEVLNIKLPDKNDQDFARSEFLKRAQEIRNFYGGLGSYDDETLAEMMLRDACFLVYHMESFDNTEFDGHIDRRLGLSGSIFLCRDFYVLENQVPLWAIKLLIRLTLFKGDADDTRVEEFIRKTISHICSDHESSDPFVLGGDRPWGDRKEQEPLHFLELIRTADLIIPRRSNVTNRSRNGSLGKILKNLKWKSSQDHEIRSFILNHPARSVMDLKAKGILLGVSSACLIDIRFQSHWLFGELLLPTFYVNNNSKVYFSNVIAFEMSPETETAMEVISYINFMQSLIESPKDVKELREKGVLSSYMNDVQVMNTFKEIDIYGMDSAIFNDVKMKIDWHCRSKAKTWLAELGHTYFYNPWSAIALLSAAVLLCLTFLQTIYSKK